MRGARTFATMALLLAGSSGWGHAPISGASRLPPDRTPRGQRHGDGAPADLSPEDRARLEAARAKRERRARRGRKT